MVAIIGMRCSRAASMVKVFVLRRARRCEVGGMIDKRSAGGSGERAAVRVGDVS